MIDPKQKQSERVIRKPRLAIYYGFSIYQTTVRTVYT